jgi:MFS family permease
MATRANKHSHAMPGAARLPIVVPVAVISFFYAAILDYALPLYFSALSTAAEARGGQFPADIWSQLVKYQVTPWIVGPLLAGLVARRYGERIVWSAALLGQAAIPIVLSVNPAPGVIPLLALWQGLTGALMWIAGISLVQMVAPEKKGLANGLMMTSVGAGSVCGPIVGRFLLYRDELLALVGDGDWRSAGDRLLTFKTMEMTPDVADFLLIFLILLASTVICGLLVGLWGQHPGRFEHDPVPDWQATLSDLGRLVRIPRVWALIIALCLLGGPVFQSSNQFLPYRAEDLGLKSGAQDAGWIWLQLLKTLMWLPGGAAVGCLAGRRAPGIAAAAMVGSFALAALGIGLSRTAWQLFACVALFEFVRQFMRWSHAGYMSEHLPGDLRVTAIGFAITFSGLGSTIYGWAAALFWDPAVDSSAPFVAAAMLGGAASFGLFLFDRLHPIREAEPCVSSVMESAAVPPLPGESLS